MLKIPVWKKIVLGGGEDVRDLSFGEKRTKFSLWVYLINMFLSWQKRFLE